MNKQIALSCKNITLVLAVAAAAMLFTSCLKNNYSPNATPVAGLMAFNLAPDQTGVFVTVSGNSITQAPLAYASFTGAYLDIYPGDRTVQSYSAATSASLASTPYNFEQGKYYSLFVVGNSSNYSNIITNDNLDSLVAVSGSGYIRYINAITDTVNHAQITISAGGNNVVSESAAFGAVNAFKPVMAGGVSIDVKSGAAIDSSRTITVEQNKVYTVLLTGVPGATDDTRKVQIRYIVNGVLTGSGQ